MEGGIRQAHSCLETHNKDMSQFTAQFTPGEKDEFEMRRYQDFDGYKRNLSLSTLKFNALQEDFLTLVTDEESCKLALEALDVIRPKVMEVAAALQVYKN